MTLLRALRTILLGLRLAVAAPQCDSPACAPAVAQIVPAAPPPVAAFQSSPQAAAAIARACAQAPRPYAAVLPERAGAVPADLRLARGRWGNDVQADRLRRTPRAADRPFTIAVVGDAEPGRFAFERLFSPGKDTFRTELRMIRARRPDLIIQLGDFVSRGTVKNYREHVRLLDEEVLAPMLSVIGNHDRSSPNGPADKSLYHAVHGGGDYYVDYGGWRLIALDTADRRLTRAQLEWLGGVLDTPSRKIVFTHVPPIYLRHRFRDHERGREDGNPRGFAAGYFSEGSEEFGDLVARHGVDRVYLGHIHAFGVATYRGVPYVLSGGGGSPLYPLPPGYPKRKMAHFILAELGSAGVLKETVVPVKGAEFALIVPGAGVREAGGAGSAGDSLSSAGAGRVLSSFGSAVR